MFIIDDPSRYLSEEELNRLRDFWASVDKSIVYSHFSTDVFDILSNSGNPTQSNFVF